MGERKLKKITKSNIKKPSTLKDGIKKEN